MATGSTKIGWRHYFAPPGLPGNISSPVPVSRTSVLSSVARLDSRHRPQTCHHPVTRRVPACWTLRPGGPARVDDSETIIHYNAATTTLQLQSVTEVASCLTGWPPSARHTAPVTQTPWNVTRRWRLETEWTLLPCSLLGPKQILLPGVVTRTLLNVRIKPLFINVSTGASAAKINCHPRKVAHWINNSGPPSISVRKRKFWPSKFMC